MKTLARATITKKGGGLQVKEINGSADSVSLEVRRDKSTQKKGTSRLQDAAMLTLNHPALGVNPGTG